ncbi:MAG: hypothetical protein ACD_60C00022G0007 [uncultured bacterium]|nr:MAG: hypothetical protein ACD_60C00022G0007 [uncultured bacterium]
MQPPPHNGPQFTKRGALLGLAAYIVVVVIIAAIFL